MSGKGKTVVAAIMKNGDLYCWGKQGFNLKAYNIGGNNYFKLRDIGVAFDFDVSWNDEVKTIAIETTSSYTAD